MHRLEEKVWLTDLRRREREVVAADYPKLHAEPRSQEGPRLSEAAEALESSWRADNQGQ